VPNEFIFVDEKAKHIDEAVDMFHREIINIEEFHRIYGEKPGFFDTEYVMQGGDTGNRSFFKLPQDVMAQDVEVLHYYNRSIDAYWCVANNITIYDAPADQTQRTACCRSLPVPCSRVVSGVWAFLRSSITYLKSANPSVT
jgi:hypothetical protein